MPLLITCVKKREPRTMNLPIHECAKPCTFLTASVPAGIFSEGAKRNTQLSHRMEVANSTFSMTKHRAYT